MFGPEGSTDDPGEVEETPLFEEALGSVDLYSDQHLGLRRASVSQVAESEVGSSMNVEDSLHPSVNFGVCPSDFDYGHSVASSLNPGSFSAGASADSERVDLEQFDPQGEFEQAWHRIGGQDTKQLWESGFWEDFFNPSSNPVDSLLRVDLKRIAQPLENPAISEETSVVALEPPVKKRVVETYMHAVKLCNNPMSWKDTATSNWEVSIRRWRTMVLHWETSASAILEIQSREGFRSQAQILIDLFYNKSPSTLLKRCNSLGRLVNCMNLKGKVFPCQECELYDYLCQERDLGAPSSRLVSLMQALTFVRHILGVEELDECIRSRRCHGASQSASRQVFRQAPPLKVEHLRFLHDCIENEDEENWNRLMSGMLLFCCYARARWSDAQHVEALIPDADEAGILQFIECSTKVHKTARALHMKNIALPLVAPCFGIRDVNWGSIWLEMRDKMGIESFELYPLMPAPNEEGHPTVRPLSTSEAGDWMCHILEKYSGADIGVRYASHSLKATTLSSCAKRGIGFEDRLCLGYHAGPLKMALTYSRDGAARPLSVLFGVLDEIKRGIFHPDSTRSGRLVAVEAANVVQDSSRESGESTWNLVGKNGNVIEVKDEVELDAAEISDDYCTSCSESSSDEECVVPHKTCKPQEFVVPENCTVWKHTKLKTCHLMFKEHCKTFLCSRPLSSMYEQVGHQQRFDVPKCRQCLKSKLLEA